MNTLPTSKLKEFSKQLDAEMFGELEEGDDNVTPTSKPSLATGDCWTGNSDRYDPQDGDGDATLTNKTPLDCRRNDLETERQKSTSADKSSLSVDQNPQVASPADEADEEGAPRPRRSDRIAQKQSLTYQAKGNSNYKSQINTACKGTWV